MNDFRTFYLFTAYFVTMIISALETCIEKNLTTDVLKYVASRRMLFVYFVPAKAVLKWCHWKNYISNFHWNFD